MRKYLAIGILFLILVVILVVAQSAKDHLRPPANWPSHSWGRLTFSYPPSWTIENNFYQEEVVGLTLSPPPGEYRPVAEPPTIVIGGHQASCPDSKEVMGRCLEIDGIIFQTTSNNPDFLEVFDQIMTTVKLN